MVGASGADPDWGMVLKTFLGDRPGPSRSAPY
jgi:hypothetical protein